MSVQNDRDERDWDEVEEVLSALRGLSEKVSSPTIRVCLESAADDIAHLAGGCCSQASSAPE
jgi:hypothetical protein